MEFSEEIAKEMGLKPEVIAKITTTGILHDIGKVGVDKSILNKPASLTPEEFEQVEKHSQLGSDIISPHDAFGEIAKYVLHHHEKLDGSGYPLGIAGKDIPLIARIIAVADIYDALSSKRPYRDELPREKCLEIMADMAKNRKIDPEIFAKFVAIATSR
jgi:HD-GYP domain-containing protein (c-di-GMP phosphodiesterase class II)